MRYALAALLVALAVPVGAQTTPCETRITWPDVYRIPGGLGEMKWYTLVNHEDRRVRVAVRSDPPWEQGIDVFHTTLTPRERRNWCMGPKVYGCRNSSPSIQSVVLTASGDVSASLTLWAPDYTAVDHPEALVVTTCEP